MEWTNSNPQVAFYRTLFLCVLLFAGCSGGDGDKPDSDPDTTQTQGDTTTQTPGDTTTQTPGDTTTQTPGDTTTQTPGDTTTQTPPVAAGGLHLALAAGSYWDYTWSARATSASAGINAVDTGAGRGQMRLGEPVVIGSRRAYPVIYSGNWEARLLSSSRNLKPEWTHLASADGAILGSRDGINFVTIIDGKGVGASDRGLFLFRRENGTWTRGTGSFQGTYNSFTDTLKLGQLVNEPRCETTAGVTSCGTVGTLISESEHFKDGWGSVGFTQSVHLSFESGSSTFDKTIELAATNLAAADGSTLQAIPWREVAALRTSRTAHSAAVYNGEIYVFGGRGANNVLLNSVEIYNPATDQWREGTPMPTATATVAEMIDGKFYVVPVGGTRVGPVQIYDPASNSWTAGASVPHAFLGSSDSAVWQGSQGGSLVLMGGGAVVSSGQLYPYAYNTATGRWVTGLGTLLSLPTHCCGAVTAVGDKVYHVGGTLSGTISGSRVTGVTMTYDMQARTWGPSRAALITARSDAEAVTVNGAVVVLGGANQAGSPLPNVEQLASGATAWQALPKMLLPRFGFAAVELDGKIYAIGGSVGGTTPLGSVEVYSP